MESHTARTGGSGEAGVNELNHEDSKKQSSIITITIALSLRDFEVKKLMTDSLNK